MQLIYAVSILYCMSPGHCWTMADPLIDARDRIECELTAERWRSNPKVLSAVCQYQVAPGKHKNG